VSAFGGSGPDSGDPAMEPGVRLPAQRGVCFSLYPSPCLCSLSLAHSHSQINKILKKRDIAIYMFEEHRVK